MTVGQRKKNNSFIIEYYYNEENSESILEGSLEALTYSDVEFIEKVSGIKSRFVLDKEGILDPKRMRPSLKERSNEEVSIQAEISVLACKEAIGQSGKKIDDIDAVICASSKIENLSFKF